MEQVTYLNHPIDEHLLESSTNETFYHKEFMDRAFQEFMVLSERHLKGEFDNH